MMAALKDTLTELLGSKKFLVLLATVAAALAARLGWNVSADAILPYLGLAASAIVAQGIADHGKGAAEVKANADAASQAALLTKLSGTIDQPKGFARLGMMLVVAGFAVACASLVACSWFHSEEKKVEAAIIDCTKGELPAVVAAVEPLVEQLVKIATGADGSVDWSQVDLKHLGASEGMCVLADLFQKRTTQPPKLARGEVAPSPEALHDAIEAHRAAHGLPATLKVHTAHGDY